MNNPILEHRQKVQERILKGFEDELEKAQYVHKYIRKEITKTGKTRYVYAESKNVERIKGKKKMIGDNKEITIDKRHKSLMAYTDEMKTELGREIQSLDGVSRLNWSNSNTTESNYLKFSKDGVKFKVRISSHTQASASNEVLFPMYYSERDRGWLIDANLGHYKPNDVKKAVENVCELLSKYDNDDMIAKLKAFADKQGIEPSDDEEAMNMSYDLAKKYVNEKKIKDDKYGSAYQVIRYVGILALGEILDEERDIQRALNNEL